jgi:hypothetical protein
MVAASAPLLEESARANPDARIRPLTHVSVDQAYQAESVGSNSLPSYYSYCYLLLSKFMSENQWGNRLFRDLKKDLLQL